MTKNWADVQDVICILYRKGYSLGTIQKRLEKEHQFKASIRSYRLRIAAWKIRRNETMCKFESSGPQLPLSASDFAAESSVDTIQLYDQALDTTRDVTGQERQRSLDSLFADLLHAHRYEKTSEIAGIQVASSLAECESDHWALLELVAGRKDKINRYELAEVLLQQEAPGMKSPVLYAVVRAAQSIMWSNPEPSQLLEALPCPEVAHSWEAIQCIMHVVTKSAVQALEGNDSGASGNLLTLLQLRQRCDLPDIPVPNKVVVAALQRNEPGLPELDQSMPSDIFIPASQEDVPGWSEYNQRLFDVCGVKFFNH